MTPFLQSAHCQPKAAALLLLDGYMEALLRLQTSGVAVYS